MHLFESQLTTPVCGFLCSAWNGHPAAHAGSRQCMHCLFTNDGFDPSVGLYNLMMLRVTSFRSDGAWCKPSRRVSGGVLFACAHALTHALHPMHRVASYKRATAAVGTGIVSVCAGNGAAMVATAAGTPVLTILLSSSRRVIDIT